jgi:hypothetical protein
MDFIYFCLRCQKRNQSFCLGTFNALKIIPKKNRNEKIMIVRFIKKLLKRKISKHLKIGNQIVKKFFGRCSIAFLAHKDDL